MKKLHLRDRLCACVFLFVFSHSAFAATVQYDYTGLDFGNPNPLDALCPAQTPNCVTNITASIGLDTTLISTLDGTGLLTDITGAVDYWSISDGLTTITEATAGYSLDLDIRTDGSGIINGWHFNLIGNLQELDKLWVI
ncbi:MAG: hypothetical protein KJO10_09905, partial [Gammaproteobacteria bacterium]|nr:hypothetical protein [Gammaproteobacteria bacterium]